MIEQAGSVLGQPFFRAQRCSVPLRGLKAPAVPVAEGVGRMLACQDSAEPNTQRPFGMRTPLPLSKCGSLPQNLSSRRRSRSRRHTRWASMYRRQRANQKETEPNTIFNMPGSHPHRPSRTDLLFSTTSLLLQNPLQRIVTTGLIVCSVLLDPLIRSGHVPRPGCQFFESRWKSMLCETYSNRKQTDGAQFPSEHPRHRYPGEAGLAGACSQLRSH